MGRKRKQKRAARGVESRQVELLPDADPAAGASGAEPGPSAGTGGSAARSGGSTPGSEGVPPAAESATSRGSAPAPEGPPAAPGRPVRETHASADSEADAGPSPEAVEPPGAPVSPSRDAPPAPRLAGERLSRAREAVEAGRIAEAIELYREILDENPANLKAHNNLGVLFDGLKQHEAALEHFEAAEALGRENVEVLTNYATALTSVGRFDEAERLLKRAHGLAPESIPLRLAFGVLAYRKGIYEQAELDLRWVCDHDGENGLAFYYHGEALNRLDRFDEAVQALGRATELQPHDPRAFRTLGHLHDRRHEPEEAAAMYRRARELQQH
jgi:tetratricopeptide (TPR) repeat protein